MVIVGLLIFGVFYWVWDAKRQHVNRYTFFNITVSYKAKNKVGYLERHYISNVVESDFDQVEKQRDKAIVQVRTITAKLSDFEYIKQVIAPNDYYYSYKAASAAMYNTVRDCDEHFANTGLSQSQTFIIE